MRQVYEANPNPKPLETSLLDLWANSQKPDAHVMAKFQILAYIKTITFKPLKSLEA